jgi:hypothetical protein
MYRLRLNEAAGRATRRQGRTGARRAREDLRGSANGHKLAAAVDPDFALSSDG